mgnify:CR=1 FL=1
MDGGINFLPESACVIADPTDSSTLSSAIAKKSQVAINGTTVIAISMEARMAAKMAIATSEYSWPAS